MDGSSFYRKEGFAMVDLHVHSTRSDGTYTPTRLVDYAMKKGLSAFALTDHDTVDGLQEAMDYADSLRCLQPDVGSATTETDRNSAAEAGHNPVPEVIPGIELSSEYQGRDVHIVGLYIDHHNTLFQDYLRHFVESRDTRNHKMCALLQAAGMDISYEKLLETFPGSVITRAHYAKYMLMHGYIKSMSEAFERYVGDHCPYYVPREKVTPAQAVELIRQAGGIPVLAHPILYHMSDTALDTLTGQLKEAGLMGIEAIYSTYHACDERQIRRLADKYQLLISGGSDFHGDNKPGLDLGVGYGRLYVPDEVLDRIKQAHQKLINRIEAGTDLAFSPGCEA